MTKLLCTGNEEKQTIAWAAKKKWPQTTLMSLSKGWDLRLPSLDDQDRFCCELEKHNVFINSSFIDYGVQSMLLDTVVKEWMKKDIKGHIISLGTTLEFDPAFINTPYVKSKLALRDLSLKYNQQTGITGVRSTYLMLGGVNNGKPENQNFIDPDRIVDVIEWVLNFSERVGLIQLDASK